MAERYYEAVLLFFNIYTELLKRQIQLFLTRNEMPV